MTVPTNFYTQQASLLPQGLQSLIQGGQLNPMPMQQALQQQQPAMQAFQPHPIGLPQQVTNYNQMASQAAPIYQAPPSIAPPLAAPPQAYQPAQQGSPTLGDSSFSAPVFNGGGVTRSYVR